MGSPGYYPTYYPLKRKEPEKPEDKPTEDRLLRDYRNLRLDIHEMEELAAGSDANLSEDDQKDMDKAIVLMKIGAKYIKQILRRRGYRKLKPAELLVEDEL